MIGKISKGQGFTRLTKYILEKEEAALVCTNLAGENPQEFYFQLGATQQLNPYVERPACHIIISFPSGEKPVEHLEDIVEFTLKGLGFNQNLYLAATHEDTDNLHLHIVASRIKIDGKCVSDWQDFHKLETLLAQLEKKFGLTKDNRSWEVIRSRQLDTQHQRQWRQQQEYELGIRDTPPEPIAIEKIQAAIAQTIPSSLDFSSFVNSLQEKGVNVGVRVSSTGKLEGLSYESDGIRFAASSLRVSQERPTFTGLQKMGMSFQLDRDAHTLAQAVYNHHRSSVAVMAQMIKSHQANQNLAISYQPQSQPLVELQEEQSNSLYYSDNGYANQTFVKKGIDLELG